MKKRFTALAAVICAAATSFTGCKKDDASSGGSAAKEKSSVMTSEDRVAEKYKDVEDVRSGPQLSISRTTAPAGGRAEVTISVENADNTWNICGLHFIYPEELDCLNLGSEDSDMVKYSLGGACDNFSLASSMEWFGDTPEDLIGKGRKMVFFTAGDSTDSGLSGDIATFFFDIPADAESGTEYPFDFYFYSTDQFTNVSGDKTMEKYAFTHWQGGSVTVE